MKPLKSAGIVLLAAVAGLAAVLGWEARQTDRDLVAFEGRVRERATPPRVTADQMAALPEPVRRYFGYTLPNGTDNLPAFAAISASGEFRRPLTDSFQPTSAEQIISTRSADFVFHATTPIIGPIWALAYDSFVAGHMEMKAKLLSAVTVMHVESDPKLDRLSLRRWLLEASSWPPALLPGGPVSWQAIDGQTARAVATSGGISESMVARFDPSGALVEMRAEADGDLTTPYHGPGEHVERSDYQLMEGLRLPTILVISRAAMGQRYPFWKAKVTDVEFGPRP